MALSYVQITDRLEQIEADLGERQTEFSKAAEDYHRLVRDYELRHARAMQVASGGTATEKKAQATIAVAASDDDLYARFLAAEGAYEGARAAVRVLETRAMIGMALLKSHAREPVVEPPAARTFGRAA
jgi:hypothetical protein